VYVPGADWMDTKDVPHGAPPGVIIETLSKPCKGGTCGDVCINQESLMFKARVRLVDVRENCFD